MCENESLSVEAKPMLPVRAPRGFRFENLNLPDVLKEEFLDQLIADGERADVEFKSYVPPLSTLARVLAAFINSGGGILLLGVEEGGRISGIPADTQLGDL
jgi:hypothetical protein